MRQRLWVAKLAYGIRASLGYLKINAAPDAPAGTVYFTLVLTDSAGANKGRIVHFQVHPRDLDTLIEVACKARRARDGMGPMIECENCGHTQEVE